MAAIQPVIGVERFDHTVLVNVQSQHVVEDAQIERLQDALEELLEQSRDARVYLDFLDVGALSTAALAALLKLQREIHRRRLRLVVCNLDHKKIVPAANDSYPHELFRVLDIKAFFAVRTGDARAAALRHAAGSDDSRCPNHTAIAC